jgi:hypothetical protein
MGMDLFENLPGLGLLPPQPTVESQPAEPGFLCKKRPVSVDADHPQLVIAL